MMMMVVAMVLVKTGDAGNGSDGDDGGDDN